MDDKTKGAWIVHHAQKLQHVTGVAGEFDNITVAGKLGLLLSSLAINDQSTLTWEQVNAIARADNINVRLELPQLIQHLEARRLVQSGPNGIDVLAVTSAAVLGHTATAFDAFSPTPTETAVIDLAEKVSATPLDSKRAAEYLGDTHLLKDADVADLLRQTEEIGFVDAEALGPGEKLLFNGHLFRRESARKVQAVLQSLSAEEMRHAAEIETQLKQHGCMAVLDVKAVLGDQLFEKLHAIGMFDVNEVSNHKEQVLYVTRPAAFGKFGDAFIDDALDLAKAFVTCLTYGMTRSASGRGRITALTALMRKLILGNWVGSATAIGEDYRVLEMKRVIELKPDPTKPGRFFMRLLKRDIGELALQVLTEGDASEYSLPNFPGAAVTAYARPETTRVATRRHQTQPSRKATANILTALRTGSR